MWMWIYQKKNYHTNNFSFLALIIFSSSLIMCFAFFVAIFTSCSTSLIITEHWRVLRRSFSANINLTQHASIQYRLLWLGASPFATPRFPSQFFAINFNWKVWFTQLRFFRFYQTLWRIPESKRRGYQKGGRKWRTLRNQCPRTIPLGHGNRTTPFTRLLKQV